MTKGPAIAFGAVFVAVAIFIVVSNSKGHSDTMPAAQVASFTGDAYGFTKGIT